LDIFFEIGTEYERDELLDFVGSQQNQSGIIWGKRQPNCLIVTTGGKHAKNAGYSDRRSDNGSWNYIGQGSGGDQDVGKYANSLLVGGERNILLFSTREPNATEFKLRASRRKFYRYEGMFDAISWEYITPTTGKRRGDKLIQVHFYPVSNVYAQESRLVLHVPVVIKDLEALKNEIKNLNISGRRKFTIQQYQLRSSLIKSYALARAKGVCEYCNKNAPFISAANVPFLEVHHILKLADDGPDTCENVAALCPNCHREAHFGLLIDEIKETLIRKIVLKEASKTTSSH